MLQIENLQWDSNFFELNIGKLVLNNEDTFNPILFNEVLKKDFDLVYVFNSQNMLSKSTTEIANLELVDIMITMSVQLSEISYVDTTVNFKTILTKNEIEDCYKIAEQIAIVSRFYNEPLIGAEKTKLLYRQWVDNALNQTFGDGVILLKKNDKISGIYIPKTNHFENIGICSLVGVNNQDRGIGIGRKLWEQSFAYWKSKSDVIQCKVSFSLKNMESFNFHLKIGFNKIEDIKYIYHSRKTKN